MQPKQRWPQACKQLTVLYQQWQLLTEAEGQAIGAQDWIGVEQRQRAKEELQAHILLAVEAARTAMAVDGVDPTPIEEEFQRMIGRLVAMEAENRDLLATLRERNERELTALDRKTLTLHHVRRAYAMQRESGWMRYS